MSRKFVPTLFALGCVMAGTTQAAELSGAIGVTGQGEMTYRAGLSRAWEQRWWQTESGHLGGYWDAGYTYWQSGDEAASAHSLSLSPVLVYTFNADGAQPFIEFGIGAALFSDTEVGGRNMSSALHFEDRLGAGLQLRNGGRLGIRAIHYSNAGLKSPNEGIESYSLVVSWPL